MAINRAYTKITKQIYDCVKTLLESGAPRPEIEKYMKIGNTTIKRIAASENWEEYQNILAEIATKEKRKRAIAAATKEKTAAKKEEPKEAPPAPQPQPQPQQTVQVIEHRQKVEVVATHYMMEALNKQIEQMTLISNKLTAIMEELGVIK